jgi:hypothetical protein
MKMETSPGEFSISLKAQKFGSFSVSFEGTEHIAGDLCWDS